MKKDGELHDVNMKFINYFICKFSLEKVIIRSYD